MMASGRRGVPLVLTLGGMLLGAPSCHGDPPTGSNSPAKGDGEWALVWSDEFDSGSTPIAPDASHWGYEQGYVRNQEWQYYTNDIRNAYCQNGFLHLEAHQHAPGTFPAGGQERQDGSISSASLISRDRVQFQFGYLEMRARIDTQWGSWPAFWSLGANVAWWKTGDARWTARWDGEQVPLDTLPASWPEEFHTWGMEWDADGVRLYMDDVLYNEWDSGVDRGDGSIEGFQQPHFFILNQAIGGKAGGDASGVVYPTHYEVDYVRLYEKAPSP